MSLRSSLEGLLVKQNYCQNIAICRDLQACGLVQCLGNDCVLDQNFKGNDGERGLMRCFKDDGTACSRLLNLKPAGGAYAPSVARLEAGKAELKHRRAEVIPEELGDAEKLVVDNTADGVDSEVVGAGLAAAGAVETRHGLTAAHLQRLAEHVSSTSFDGLPDWFDL